MTTYRTENHWGVTIVAEHDRLDLPVGDLQPGGHQPAAPQEDPS